MNVYQTIGAIIEERRSRRIVPTHALLRDVMARSEGDRSRKEEEMRGLLRMGIIRVGRTLNDYYVKFAENGMDV